MATKRVRDPIHQLIRLEEQEWLAVGTPAFQRLRRIRQLALTDLVYPGATHTRFEHSIGVRHVADRLAEAVGLDQDERRRVRHAALLHDIGHGPFSHVSEQVAEEVSGRSNVHETVSVLLLRHDEGLHAALGKDECEEAALLVSKERERCPARDIVSGPTDADKLDYLLRDSYYAGVEYGRFDLERLVDTVTVVGDPDVQSYLGFEVEGVWAVEGLLLARHHMHRQVYGHKTRVATDIMVTRALRAAVADGVIAETSLSLPAKDASSEQVRTFLDEYLGLTDRKVMHMLLHESHEGSVARDLAERLERRELLRRTVQIELTPRGPERLDHLSVANILDKTRFTAEKREEAEASIADEVSVPTHLVAIYLDSRKNPTHRGPGSSLGDESVLLKDHRGRTTSLEQESEIFQRESVERQEVLSLYTPKLSDTAQQRAEEVLWDVLAKVG